ncbi:MAG: hypothetical protein V1738_02875 [Patescibacteria group bacterium]
MRQTFSLLFLVCIVQIILVKLFALSGPLFVVGATEDQAIASLFCGGLFFCRLFLDLLAPTHRFSEKMLKAIICVFDGGGFLFFTLSGMTVLLTQ